MFVENVTRPADKQNLARVWQVIINGKGLSPVTFNGELDPRHE